MDFGFTAETSKDEVFAKIGDYLSELGVEVDWIDLDKPWGGEFYVKESSTDLFINTFFPGYDIAEVTKYGSKLTPKLLIVMSGGELSWQYHFRRAELWSCVAGPVGFKRSKDDTKGETNILQPGEIVQFNPGERHTLIGLDSWGVIAEFWQHTDPNQPSDKEDIVRLNDKYGR